MRIIVFGDSISEGFWDYEKGGWVNMLKTYLWKKYGYDNIVMNYGISAYTSYNILTVFQYLFDACSRREYGKEKDSIVIIAVGINDSSIDKKTKNPRVNKEHFIKNINLILDKCKNDDLIKKVIFVGNINVDEDIINNDKEGEFLFYNEEIEKYNEIIKNISLENNINYIDLFGLMCSEYLEDGLHPNTKGHTKIFEKVKEYIIN